MEQQKSGQERLVYHRVDLPTVGIMSADACFPSAFEPLLQNRQADGLARTEQEDYLRDNMVICAICY